MTKPTPQPEPPKTAKRLYRSRRDRMLAGVAGGMADYFGIDASLMRLISVPILLLPDIGAGASSLKLERS